MPLSNPLQRRDYEQRVNRAIDFIQRNLSREISLDELASVAAFSPYHFHRIFTAMVGEPVMAFARRLRVERAASDLLTNPERSITSIALDCGFNSPEVFARHFRARFGVTAGEWRANSGISKNDQADSKQDQVVLSGPRYAPQWWALNAQKITEEELVQVEIVDMPAIRAAYVRRMGSYFNSPREAWELLCRWAGPRRLLGPDTMYFGISYDSPEITEAAKLRYDACIAVGPEVKAEGEVGILDVPAQRVASARYDGPGEGIASAYQSLYRDWLPTSGFVPADAPCFEVYRHDLGNVPEENHFVMDICLPLKPA